MRIMTGWYLAGATVLWISGTMLLPGRASSPAPAHGHADAHEWTVGEFRPLFDSPEATWNSFRGSDGSASPAELRGLQSVLDALEGQWQELRGQHQRILDRHYDFKEALGRYEVVASGQAVTADPRVDFQRVHWNDGELRLVKVGSGESAELDRMTDVLHAFTVGAQATVREYLEALDR